jgi:hypothetical protein
VVIDLLERVSSVDDLFYRLDDLPVPDIWKGAILVNKGRIKLNYAMVEYQEIAQKDLEQATVVAKYEPAVLEMLYKMLKFDLAKVDMRVVRSLEELSEPDPNGGFFQYSKYRRA